MTRSVYAPETDGFVDSPVYDRYALTPGDAFVAPAIFEERESTLVIGPDAHATMDAWGSLVVEPSHRQQTEDS